MATHYYWIPQNHHALHKQANLTGDYLADLPNRERMGLASTTPQGQWIDEHFFPKLHQLNEAFLDWENASIRTPVKYVHLREAKAVFKPVYRQLYIGLLKSNPLVTDIDLTGMNLPERRAGAGTAAHVAALPPDADVDTSVIRRLGIHFFEGAGRHRKAKPAGQHGAEIRWVKLDTTDPPPSDIPGFVNVAFAIRTPHILEFDEFDRGKVVYFILCWENTCGLKGPYSPFRKAIIP
jgi:hypothetical protein